MLFVVASSGGHWTQIQRIQSAFDGWRVRYATYRNPQTDGASDAIRLHELGYNPFRYAAALLTALRVLRRERPDVMISTGSEIAIPFFFAARMLGIHTIYIESLTRVNSRSFTGKVLLRVADEFYVQWPEMAAHFGDRAEYRGNVL